MEYAPYPKWRTLLGLLNSRNEMDFAMNPNDIKWERYPLVAQNLHTRTWLTIQCHLQLATNTIEAYARSLENYLTFCQREQIELEAANRGDVAGYVNYLSHIPRPNAPTGRPSYGLANATIHQRLTVVRLFYDYLIEEQIRTHNPVGRGRYTPGKSFGGQRQRGLIPSYRQLPWIPNEEEWLRIIAVVREERIRNRVMFALCYETALRREELCLLKTGDINPTRRLVHVRAETTKNRQGRVVPYTAATSTLYMMYLQRRRDLSRERGPLFLSESRRNYGQPISIWTWSKVMRDIALRAEVPQFTPHTLRHLCLTDLARANWDVHDIATFAGHRSIQSTMLYIHLSGRDLSDKVANSMAGLHARRLQMLSESVS